MPQYNTTQTIGFITGGQLGRMMIESFLPFLQHEHIIVLDSDPKCPCSRVCDEVVVGSSKSYNDVIKFGKRCDTIILEFEHVNSTALKELASLGKTVVANPEYIDVIQDKGVQKKFLNTHSIPTSKFFVVENRTDLLNRKNELSYPCVQKTCLDGYDGGGVKKIASGKELIHAFDTKSIIEECILIQKEFSLLCGRDIYGSEFRYPLIEQSFHEDTHIVDRVWFAEDVDTDVQDQVNHIGDQILSAFPGVGMYAVELFLDIERRVLVNEIAPRVHNSGHHTQECSETSQFEQYMRVALGLPCGSVKTIQKGVMKNILGSKQCTGLAQYNGVEKLLKHQGINLHWYGKKTCKMHRKMGHLTLVSSSIQESHVLLDQVDTNTDCRVE